MQGLRDFLTYWDQQQRKTHSQIDLFKSDKIKTLTLKKKQQLIKVFYHLRGHFHDFLWLMGNFAPNEKAKEAILDNIREEFGEKYTSHELLYFEFAEQFGIDLKEEVVSQESYVPFAKEFNRKHLAYLMRQDWEGKVVAFAAYERLDNIDYPDLLNLAKNLRAKDRGLLFFEVHTKVEHFEMASELLDLEELWQRDKEKVILGFEFIGEHQNRMWRELSELVFG